MEIDSLSHRVQTSVFELTYLMMSSKAIVVLHLVSYLVHTAQSIALGFNPILPWNQATFQNRIFYLVIPWTVNGRSFIFVSGFTLLVSALWIVALIRISGFRSFSQSRTFILLRFLFTMIAGVFLLPFCKTLLWAFENHLNSEGVSTVTSRDATAATVVAILSFLSLFGIMSLNSVIQASPDLMAWDRLHLAATISSRQEAFSYTLQMTLIIIGTFTEAAPYATLFFLVHGCQLLVSIVFPCFVKQRMNYWNGGLHGFIFSIGCFCLAITRTVSTATSFTTTSSHFTTSLSSSSVSPSPVSEHEEVMVGAGADTLYLALGISSGIALLCAVSVYFRMRYIGSLRRFVGQEDGGREAVDRCRIPFDVELLVRTCLERRSLDEIIVAIDLFDAAFEKFPYNAYLFVSYSRFVLYVAKPVFQSEVKSRYENVKKRSIHQVNTTLKNLQAMKAKPDVRFYAFALKMTLDLPDISLELGEKRLASPIRAIQYQADFARARSHHFKAHHAIRLFWNHVKLAEPDQSVLDFLSSKISSHTETASRYYDSLVNEFPNAANPFRAYSLFFKTILKDEETANEIAQNIPRIEAYRNEHNKSVNTLDMDLEGDDPNRTEIAAQMLSKTYGRSRGAAGPKRQLQLTTRLLAFMMLTCISFCIGYGGLFLYQKSIFANYDMEDINTLGTIRTIGQDFVVQSRKLEMCLTFGICEKSLSEMQTDLRAVATNYTNAVVKGGRGTLSKIPFVLEQWTETDISVLVRSSTGEFSSYQTDAKTLFFGLSNAATNFGFENITSLQASPALTTFNASQSSKLLGNTDWFFMMDNGVQTVLPHSWHIVNAAASGYHMNLEKQQRNILIAAYLIILGPLLLGAMLIFPIWKRANDDKAIVFNLFTLVDQESLLEVLAGLRTLNQGFGGDGKSMSSSHLTTESDYSMDNNDGFTSNALRATSKMSSSRQLAWAFGIVVVSLIAGISVSSVLTYNTCDLLHKTSIEMNYVGSREVTATRLLALSQELIRGDPLMNYNRTTIREMMDDEIEQVRRSTDAL